MTDWRVDTADGTLVVIVCRAKHLPNRRKFDKQLPYVTLRIGTEARKTPSHFRAGQTPEWTHEVRFDLLVERKPLLVVDVLDETKNDPTMIGHAEIDCLKVFAPENERDGKYISDAWHELKFNDKRAGLIYMEMTFYPATPLLPPKVPIEGDYPELPAGPTTVPDQVAATPNYHALALAYESHPRAPPRPQRGLPALTLYHTFRDDYTADTPRQPERVHDYAPFGSADSHSLAPPLPAKTGPPSHPARTIPHSPTLHDLTPLRSLPEAPAVPQHRSLPPKHPKQAKPPLAADDVFVLLLYKAPGLSKKLKKFAHNQYTAQIQPLPMPVELPEEKKGLKGRLAKFRNKFEAREPILVLWKELQGSLGLSHFSDLGFRLSLPLLDYESEAADLDPEVPPPVPKHLVTSSGYLPPQQDPDATADFSKLRVLLTAVPFSADLIGLDDSAPVPTQVFLMNEPVKPLTHAHHPSLDPRPTDTDELDPKYYAPQPTEELNQTLRLQNGCPTSRDLHVDLRTHRTGYLGNGKFSPSIFERAVLADDEDDAKPPVPPKIPLGLLEREYYLTDRKLYMRDISGHRI